MKNNKNARLVTKICKHVPTHGLRIFIIFDLKSVYKNFKQLNFEPVDHELGFTCCSPLDDIIMFGKTGKHYPMSRS